MYQNAAKLYDWTVAQYAGRVQWMRAKVWIRTIEEISFNLTIQKKTHTIFCMAILIILARKVFYIYILYDLFMNI